MMTCSMPAATASSTAYWMIGLSTRGSISFGCALVAGRKRVPQPAAGKTAFRTRIEPLGQGQRCGQYTGELPPDPSAPLDRRLVDGRDIPCEGIDLGREGGRPVEAGQMPRPSDHRDASRP